jgi:hypothetical protein
LAPQYKITGSGLIRALQEATSARKKVCIVFDHDNLGNILRCGYFFKSTLEKDFKNHEIHWFKSNEIRVIPDYSGVIVPKNRLARLDVEFNQPLHKNWQFLLSIPSDSNSHIILRNLFRIHGNLVSGFVIQVEIHTHKQDGKDQVTPVVRYDCAHGFIHRDDIAADGEKTKHKLPVQNTRGAITFAIVELRDNLNLWLHQLGYKQFDINLLIKPDIYLEMNKAKSTLLDLFDHPEKMKKAQSTLIQFKDKLDYHQRIWPSE